MASTSDTTAPALLRAWRLVKSVHADHAFDGEGAFRYGGRWNSRGTALVYASSSLALAALELLVHLDPAMPVPPLVAFRIDLHADLILDQAPPGAPDAPGDLSASRRIGDQWVREGRSLALRVPSAVVPLEHNFLLNPNHPRFPDALIHAPTPFTLDPRLIRWLPPESPDG